MILTNNDLIDNENRVVFIEGFTRDVLLQARDLIHKGHTLLTSPLAASGKMNYSPIRSIVLSDNPDGNNSESILLIENAVARINKILKTRNFDYENIDGYKLIDSELLFSALDEIDLINKKTEV